MPADRKSYELDLALGSVVPKPKMMEIVEHAAADAGLYISHIGGYSRVKYPNSVHWHFKRDTAERGLIDATYWQEGQRFWLIVRHREPDWVHETAPRLQQALQAALAGA